MIINTKLKFVYLAMPHTASRATHAALLQLEGSTSGPHNKLGHHGHLRTARPLFPELDFSEFTVFHSVRHPGDWLVTRYLCRGKVVIDFSTFIRQKERHLLSRFTTDQVDAFVRYEHLEADLKAVTGQDIKLGFDERHVTTGKQPWQSYWNQEDAEWANSYFRDFQLYGYDPIQVENV